MPPKRENSISSSTSSNDFQEILIPLGSKNRNEKQKLTSRSRRKSLDELDPPSFLGQYSPTVQRTVNKLEGINIPLSLDSLPSTSKRKVSVASETVASSPKKRYVSTSKNAPKSSLKEFKSINNVAKMPESTDEFDVFAMPPNLLKRSTLDVPKLSMVSKPRILEKPVKVAETVQVIEIIHSSSLTENDVVLVLSDQNRYELAKVTHSWSPKVKANVKVMLFSSEIEMTVERSRVITNVSELSKPKYVISPLTILNTPSIETLQLHLQRELEIRRLDKTLENLSSNKIVSWRSKHYSDSLLKYGGARTLVQLEQELLVFVPDVLKSCYSLEYEAFMSLVTSLHLKRGTFSSDQERFAARRYAQLVLFPDILVRLIWARVPTFASVADVEVDVCTMVTVSNQGHHKKLMDKQAETAVGDCLHIHRGALCSVTKKKEDRELVQSYEKRILWHRAEILYAQFHKFH